MKNTIIAIVLVVLGAAVYYLFFRNPSTVDNTSSAQAPAQNVVQTPIVPVQTPVSNIPAATPSSASVSIAGFAFNPVTSTVKVGTTVTWTNNDNVSHTVTSDTDGLLNSSTLSPGHSFSFTFTKAGTTTYHCTIHPMMKGTIVVTS